MAGLIVPTTNKECQGVYEFCLFIHCFLVDLSLTLYVKVLCLLSLLLFLNCLSGHQGLLIEKSLHHLDAAGVKGSRILKIGVYSSSFSKNRSLILKKWSPKGVSMKFYLQSLINLIKILFA